MISIVKTVQSYIKILFAAKKIRSWLRNTMSGYVFIR